MDRDEELLLAVLNSAPVVDGRRRTCSTARPGAELRAGLGRHRHRATSWRGCAVPATRCRPSCAARRRRASTELARASWPTPCAPRASRADGVDWELRAPDDDRLAVEAVLAWSTVAARFPGRLRACANDECNLFLLDHSRPGTAKWCSMATCGNRMKARAHAEPVAGLTLCQLSSIATGRALSRRVTDISLTPIPDDRLAAWRARASRDYVEARVLAGQARESAQAASDREWQQLFSGGERPADHLVMHIVVEGVGAGWIWVGPATAGAASDWWLWDIQVDEPYRGRGIAAAAIAEAEELARERGACGSAATHSAAARRRLLYERLGYDTESTRMRKRLS